MYCIQCGAQIADGSKFCMACGAPQRPSADTAQQAGGAGRETSPDARSGDVALATQHLELAYQAMGRGLLPNALRECDLALQAAPHMSEAHNTRGQVLERLNRPLEARTAYERAANLSPEYTEARQNMTRLNVMIASGRGTEGRTFTSLSSTPERSSGMGVAVAGAVVGIVGGALIVLGWLTPWFGIGGLLGALGSMAGLSGRGLLGSGSGIGLGSGVQLMTALLAGGLAAFGLEVYWLGFLAWLLAGVLVTIPILGGLIVRQGIRFLELRADRAKISSSSIRTGCQSYRGQSGTVFGIMLSFFILLALLGGASMLGLGFYMTMLGAIGTYVASIVLRSQASQD